MSANMYLEPLHGIHGLAGGRIDVHIWMRDSRECVRSVVMGDSGTEVLSLLGAG